MSDKIESLEPADLLDKATFLGPLSSAQALETIQAQYDNAVKQGATVLVAAEMPFGGVKQSGFGRELGPYGMSEFVNFKPYNK